MPGSGGGRLERLGDPCPIPCPEPWLSNLSGPTSQLGTSPDWPLTYQVGVHWQVSPRQEERTDVLLLMDRNQKLSVEVSSLSVPSLPCLGARTWSADTWVRLPVVRTGPCHPCLLCRARFLNSYVCLCFQHLWGAEERPLAKEDDGDRCTPRVRLCGLPH